MSADLPGVLREIAEAAGADAALAIAAARGGTQVYIPPSPKPEHWLTQLIGLEAARAVADRLTCGLKGLRVEIPLGPAGHLAQERAKLDALIAEGRSERDIALTTRYSTRTIRRRRAALGKTGDDRQMTLF